MSLSSDRGKKFELEVASILRKKLGVRVHRDSRSGAGASKQDIRDYFQELPFSLELKDHETIKIKDWMRQAISAASFSQVPTLVFRMDEEIIAAVRFSDLVNLALEIADLRAENTDLRSPTETIGSNRAAGKSSAMTPGVVAATLKNLQPVIKKKLAESVKIDANGHITDQFGYCNQKGCKFSRGYKKPKEKKS